jgi:hypothetical protein
MHFVTLSTAKTLYFELPLRCDDGATFVVKSPSGGTVQASASVTRTSVDTTLNGALAAGATTATVTSASNVRVGGRYIIGSAGNGTATREDLGAEVVTIKSKSGTTLTLTTPLRYAHASGELFQSREVSCVVAAASVASVGRHYRIEVTYSADDGTAASTVAQPVHVESFDVVRYTPVTSLDFAQVQALDPVLVKRLPAGFWWPAVRDATWEMVLRRVAAKTDPGALVGAVNLTTAHGYLVREVLAETAGEEWRPYREDMARRFTEEMDATVSTMPVDGDQDGQIEAHERVAMQTIDVARG